MSYINENGELKIEPTLESEEEIFSDDFIEIAKFISDRLSNPNVDHAMAISEIFGKYINVLDNPATNKGRTLREYFNLPR